MVIPFSWIVVLALVVAATVVLVRWLVLALLKKDKQIDLWQEDVSKFAAFLASHKLTRLADVFHAIAAIDVTGAIGKIGELRREIMEAEDQNEKFLELVRPCLFDTLPRLLDERHPLDTKAIVKAVVDSPAGWAALEAHLLEEHGLVLAPESAGKPAA